MSKTKLNCAQYFGSLFSSSNVVLLCLAETENCVFFFFKYLVNITATALPVKLNQAVYITFTELYFYTHSPLITRPGVARAVLQTAL